jgi:hypothetical protein
MPREYEQLTAIYTSISQSEDELPASRYFDYLSNN